MIKVNKAKLIAKIQENKENHIKEYEKAVIAYKKEALKQLNELIIKVDEGTLNIRLELVTPVNNSKEYDSNIEMLQWEVEEEVELTQEQFKELVQDKTSFAEQARVSNAYYMSQY